MQKIQLNEVKGLIKNPVPVGSGKSAYCYLCQNNIVFKKFKNNYESEEVTSYERFNEILDDLYKLSTPNFIGPKVLVYDEDKLVGYLYEYIKGRELKYLSINTRVSTLLYCYKELINQVDRFADKKIRVNDIHHKNVIYDGSFRIIDLDRYFYQEKNSKEALVYANRNELFNAVINKIYRLKPWELGEYDYQGIEESYYKCTDSGDIYPLLNRYREICNKEEPTIGEVRRKTLMRRVFNEYSKEAKEYECN